jgi:hypothetical protein
MPILDLIAIVLALVSIYITLVTSNRVHDKVEDFHSNFQRRQNDHDDHHAPCPYNCCSCDCNCHSNAPNEPIDK